MKRKHIVINTNLKLAANRQTAGKLQANWGDDTQWTWGGYGANRSAVIQLAFVQFLAKLSYGEKHNPLKDDI